MSNMPQPRTSIPSPNAPGRSLQPWKHASKLAFCVVPLIGLPLALASPGLAVDHNNLDAGRPLSFDDAESLGLGEQALEVGVGVGVSEGHGVGAEFDVEYLYGIAPDTHINVGIDPRVGGRSNTDDTGFDPGDVSVGVFHNFNREFDNTPAFAVRADTYFPTGQGSQGVDFRLRGIASKTVRQYDRLHLNLDLGIKSQPEGDERRVVPGVVLGYSRPLGYPRRFDRTGLAELGIRAGDEKGTGPTVTVGIGLRQQVGYQNVFDIGIQSDLVADDDHRDLFRLVAGYSTAF
jgi:hypothetical protein